MVWGLLNTTSKILVISLVGNLHNRKWYQNNTIPINLVF